MAQTDEQMQLVGRVKGGGREGGECISAFQKGEGGEHCNSCCSNNNNDNLNNKDNDEMGNEMVITYVCK